jgi:hypothetical protein
MKKIAYLISFIMLLGQASWAQTNPSPQPNQQGKQEPRTLSDKNMSSKLQQDLGSRNKQLNNQQVSWYDAGYGYYGTYDLDGKSYMERYDRQGNYVETLTRRDWDNTIPSSSRTAFDNSAYKGQQVIGYWESTNPQNKHSYFELRDNTGKTSRVWADDNGKFGPQPSPSSSGTGAGSTTPRPGQ